MCIQVFILSRTHFLSFFFPSMNKGPTTFWKSAPPLGVRLLLHSYFLDSFSYAPSRELSTHFQEARSLNSYHQTQLTSSSFATDHPLILACPGNDFTSFCQRHSLDRHLPFQVTSSIPPEPSKCHRL